jgi:hypothetical protein
MKKTASVQSPISLTSQSNSPYVDFDVQNVPSSQPPKAQDVLLDQWRMKCNISRQYPNQNLGKSLLKELGKAVLKKKASNETKATVLNTIDTVDEAIWTAMGLAVSYYATPLAGKIVGIVGSLAIARTNEIIQDFEDSVARGDKLVTDSLANIGIIMGEDSYLLSLREELSALPQEEISQKLSKLLQVEAQFKSMIQNKMGLSWLWNSNVYLRITLYSALAKVQYTIQILCDRLFFTTTPMDSFDVGSNSSNGKSSPIPLLLLLGLGAKLLL